MNEHDPNWGTLDVTKTDSANQAPSSTTRRKIPCVNLGRVVNVDAPIIQGHPMSER